MKYEEMYKEYAQFVYTYLLSITGSRQLAEDLTSETFLKALRSKGYEPGAKVTTWLCTIAHNAYISYLRKHRHDSGKDINELELAAEDDMLSGVNVTEIYKAIHTLGEPYSEVILLKIHSDMNYCQIGEVFGKSENWARVTFFRGKEKLRNILKERNGDEK